MPSKMVSDRQKTALALQAAALQHADLVAESFGARDASEGSVGATDVELANLLTQVADRLARHADELVRADSAKFGELHKDQALRDRRYSLAANLARLLSDQRQIVDGAFGAGASVGALGLEGSIGRDPVVVHLKALEAMGRLEQGNLAKLGAQRRGVAVDPEELQAELREAADELGAMLTEISAADRKSEALVVAKKASLEAFDQQARWAARLLEGAFGLAGQVDLAVRVRRTVRRNASEEPVIELPEAVDEPELAPVGA
ncbi:MAG: hypothetical protein KDD47_07705 [Acidobacteria bacterium]|nr:hypothetical protein [Acidobacteriota bacterium]